MSSSIEPTTHAIFDLGGTIFTIESFLNLFEEMLKRNGNPHKLPPGFTKILREGGRDKEMSYHMYNIDDILHMILKEVGIEDNQKTVDEHKTHLMKAIFEVGLSLSPGIDRLLRHLRDHNIPMAIATNGAQNHAEMLYKVIRGFDASVFDHKIYGNDNPKVINNKPAPDIYLVCANTFKDPPKSVKNCVVFEDSLMGIEGAIASGMKTVLINDQIDSNFDEVIDKITSVVNSFEEFKPESVGLPQYEFT